MVSESALNLTMGTCSSYVSSSWGQLIDITDVWEVKYAKGMIENLMDVVRFEGRRQDEN